MPVQIEMEMPKKCRECYFVKVRFGTSPNEKKFECFAMGYGAKNITNNNLIKKKPLWCPLKELV